MQSFINSSTMKKAIPCFILCFIIKMSFAQIIVCPGDSLKITLENYIDGSNIQWEKSPDNTAYFTVAGATGPTLSVAVSSTQYYRAHVQEDTACPAYISDTIYTYNLTWNANLSVDKLNPQTVGSNSFYSASKLKASWNTAPLAVDHYELTAVENIKGTSISVTSPSTQLTDTLTGLKSSTAYTVSIKGCIDEECTSYISCLSNSASDTTGEEYWQLQGTGDTTTTLTTIVSDGNTLNYAFVYGDWELSGLEGYIRYYYNPMNGSEKGVKPAISSYLPVTNVDSTAINFTGLIGNGLTFWGWTTIGTPKSIGQSSAIPYNGFIRLFFEAELGDGVNRIFYIDSKDGYMGLDFNSDSSTYCANPNDFQITGGCQFNTAIGVESDTGSLQNISITDIRQFKIGYKTMDSWLWTGANNTFMAVTFDLDTTVTCGNVYTFTTGYAVWDSANAEWDLQYDGTCPKFFDGMQAPSIMHLGGSKYKLYYNQNEILKGKPHNPQTDTKPMKVFYAEATNGIVNFEDWESISDARDLNYLWPDGSLLTVSQESKLDDYHFFAPTNDLDFQVQYTNISNGVSTPFVTAAILLNP